MKANLRLRSLRTNLRDPRSGPCFRAKSGDRVRDRSSPSRARGDPPADREGSGRRPCARKPPRDGRDLTGARGEGRPADCTSEAKRRLVLEKPLFGAKMFPVMDDNPPCYATEISCYFCLTQAARWPRFLRQDRLFSSISGPTGAESSSWSKAYVFSFPETNFVLESIFGKARSRASVQSQKMFAMAILWPLRGAIELYNDVICLDRRSALAGRAGLERGRKRPHVRPRKPLLRGLPQQVGGMEHRERPDRRPAVALVVEP